MLNRAIDQLPKRLMVIIRVKGAHVKFRLDLPHVKMIAVVSLCVE